MTDFAAPVAVEYLRVKKDLLKSLDLLASIDTGCTMTKLLYVNRENYLQSQTADEINFTLELYPNYHFSSAVDSLMKNMAIPENPEKYILKVTGVGCEKEIELLKTVTPFQIKFVDEFYCQSLGSRWLLQNLPEEEICHSRNEFDEEIPKEELIGMYKVFSEKILSQIEVKDQHEPIPCIFAFLGSGVGYVKIEENGKMSIIGGISLGTKSFHGLCKLILGTRHYDEILAMAEKGDRCNVDTQIKDILKPGEETNYGEFDGEKPIFPFGKILNNEKQLEDFNREDLADSLLYLYISNLLSSIAAYARGHNIRRIYLGGNFVRGRYVRKVLTELAGPIYSKFCDFYFCKTGHTAAFGALLASNDGPNSLW